MQIVRHEDIVECEKRMTDERIWMKNLIFVFLVHFGDLEDTFQIWLTTSLEI